ncbi:hypothetical protein SB767_33390, partial [Bacillus sp. SIMBA_069]
KRKVPSNEYLRGELFVEDIKYIFEDAPQNLESLITADKTASFNRRQVNRKSSKASIGQTSEKRNLCSQNLHRFLPYLLGTITNQ